MRVFVVVESENQLANRLFVFAALIGAAAEHGATVINLGFREYADLFPSTADDVLSRYPPRRTAWLARPRLRRDLQRVARRLVRLTASESTWAGRIAKPLVQVLQSGSQTTLGRTAAERATLVRALDAPQNARRLRERPVTVFSGPLIRARPAMWKHREEIRRYFRPSNASASEIEATLAPLRQRCEVLVGVHLRRGDYDTFEGGRYLYSFAQYRHAMERVGSLFGGRSVGYLLCSNDLVPTDVFDELPFVAGPGGLVEDLYALARCDYIIGPPSTFSAWASFYGDVPLYFLHDVDRTPTLEDFAVADSLDDA